MLETLDKAAVNYQVVLTKTDEVKNADLAGLVAATKAALAKHPAAYPEVVLTSSRTGAGIARAARGDRAVAPGARRRIGLRTPGLRSMERASAECAADTPALQVP